MRHAYIIAAVLLLGLSLRCAHQTEMTPEQKAVWTDKMHELSHVLSTLFPYLLSKEQFHDEKNAETINQNVKRLTELAHTVNISTNEGAAPDPDPAIKFLAKGFDSEVTKAFESFQTGHKEYSRQVLALATNHCINCHSRSQDGGEKKVLNLAFEYDKLNPFVRAEIYGATRQFEKSIQEYKEIVKQKDLIANYPFEIERALKKALAIYVRVLNDPKGAQDLLTQFLQNEDLPKFLERQANVWKEDLVQWQKEGVRKGWTEKSYLKNMNKLIAEGQRREGTVENDNPLINYLRATALGHEYFKRFKKDEKFTEVLFQMGVSYEFLQDLGYWTLNEDYFTQCIKERPHSSISAKCYNRLEQSIFLGYTGSAGTKLPPDVRAQLRELKNLAM